MSMTSDCNGCGHCTELYTPSSSDPAELNETRRAIDKWIADIITYRPETGKEMPQTFLQ